MSRRKEYSIAFVLFFLLVFVLLIATVTITSVIIAGAFAKML